MTHKGVPCSVHKCNSD